MSFSINCLGKIFIYGAGTLGQEYCERLVLNGYNVCGIIDKNPKKNAIECGIRIFCLSDYAFDEEDIVIVCVHNALWHSDIVNALVEKNVHKILFIPIGEHYIRNKSDEMLKKYSLFSDNQFGELTNIPTIEDMTIANIDEKNSVIIDNNEFITFWIDISVLFSSLKKEYIEKMGGNKSALKYCDVPMPGMKPYVDLFNHIKDNNSGDIELFYEVMGKLQNSFVVEKNEFIMDRYELYYTLNRQLNYGMDSFIYSAPYAEYDTRGFFRLKDGMSRTTFLYTQGFQFVPIRVSRNDFSEWNNCNCEWIKEYFKNLKILELDVEVEHSVFFDFPVKRAGRIFDIICSIEEYFSCLDIKDMKVLDATYTRGRVGRVFCRKKSSVIQISRTKEFALDANINSLLKCDSILIQSELEYDYEKGCSLACFWVKKDNVDLENLVLFGDIISRTDCILLIMDDCDKSTKDIIRLDTSEYVERCIFEENSIVRRKVIIIDRMNR